MRVTTINAYAVKHRAGRAEPFSYERRLGDNDVLVRITHCSMARGDAGANVADLPAGARVGVGYQQAACFSCEYCRSGDEQFCPEQKVIGVDCFGGAAEHIVVDHRFAFRLPAALDSATSTPLLSSGLTVYSAFIRAGLRDRSEVAVLGVGGLGHLAIQFSSQHGTPGDGVLSFP